MQDINASILTRADLTNRTFASSLVEAIIASHEDFQPKRYGSYEPLPYRAQTSGVQELMERWQSPFFWSNGRRASVSFWFDSPNIHNSIGIEATGSRVNGALMRDLTIELGISTAAELATVHRQFEDQPTWLARYAASYPLRLGFTTHNLRKSLPDLAWVTLFGLPYIELFGRERLAGVPAAVSKAVGDQHWLLQLTDEEPSARESPSQYEQTRDLAKAHLGLEHFLDLERPERQKVAPRFLWSHEIKNELVEHLRSRGLLTE